MSGPDRLPEWRYVVRRTVALAVAVTVAVLVGVAVARWVGVDVCAEDFACLPEAR